LYSTILTIHSWVRWIALVSVVGATLAALMGRVETDRSPADRWGLAAIMALDIQMLLGLLLYLVISPNMRPILANFGAAMKDPALRFWAVEHTVTMIAAIGAAHIARALAGKAATVAAKRTRLLVGFGISALLIILGMPWPGRPGGRPLFRV
jgi:hypothetical protein